MIFQYLLAATVLVFLGYSIYRMVKYGGIKGAYFGRAVAATTGEVYGSLQGVFGGEVSVTLRVYALKGSSDEDTRVGLALFTGAGPSSRYNQCMWMNMPRSETRRLIPMLESVVGKPAI